ncbi:hypothetical protein [Candidatus Mycolicibacterium alkanivorans]|uniref:Uncharacterized protein n=1 Tax=Candidatus Mycolicibacterium alkanivorans TaxID=2954114 RepID=A0ABS9YR41_9MYCO|nr:hypothetical protein [Candidatus Mycolicibacterium alkanivorans]MCI4673711.1 hypothetical protein [Candidatus Mycolicibacterium alkanivorans]
MAGFRGGYAKAADPLGAIFDLIWGAPIAASAVIAAVLEPVPHHLHDAMLEFVCTATDTLRGILIPAFVESDRGRARRRWETAATALRRMAHPDLVAWLNGQR